jgi:hypothetical protein
MLPVFIDIHIHTSSNPEHLNQNYDYAALGTAIATIVEDNPFLLSLTDHNVINKRAYLSIPESLYGRFLLGSELHILNRTTDKIYHCHIIFSAAIDETTIDSLNVILNKLYPSKNLQNITVNNAPDLTAVLDAFIDFEYLLLPHGGQRHRRFLDTLPSGEPGVGIDKAFENELYHNHFDGFTGRNEGSVIDTKTWFKRLGVESFTNLITCSDNYRPSEYPQPNAGEESQEFIPTWMASEPTFSGLRLALSEATRLYYQTGPPNLNTEHISRVRLSNNRIDIAVDLTPGLNVVVGGSSSGKTLFVDSLARKIRGGIESSVYASFGVSDILVDNPSNRNPHYISQNFISSAIKNGEGTLESIDIIKEAFPMDANFAKAIEDGVIALNRTVTSLINNIKELNRIESELGRLMVFTRLFSDTEIFNIFDLINPGAASFLPYEYTEVEWRRHAAALNEIAIVLEKNPLLDDSKTEIDILQDHLHKALTIGKFEATIRNIIRDSREQRSRLLQERYGSEHSRLEDKRKLFELIPEYVAQYDAFKHDLETIINLKQDAITIPRDIQGYRLTIQNDFCIDETVVVEALNEYLKANFHISDYSKITPHCLNLGNFNQTKVHSYDELAAKITSHLRGKNRTTYKIVSNDGKDFYDMSPGWRSATVLDIILGNNTDYAPIIIDQPEDNLAVNYINTRFVEELKRVKRNKQVILVSHNATIPMLGDAQQIVLCQVDKGSGKLSAKSASLEGEIDGTPMLDHIADITDGGKPAIRKRVRKYNIRSVRGKHEATI